MIKMAYPEESLIRLLDYDGKLYGLASGHWLKFEVRGVTATNAVPHGMAYSFTLHASGGERLLEFDNANSIPHPGSAFVARPEVADHWHRSRFNRNRHDEDSVAARVA